VADISSLIDYKVNKDEFKSHSDYVRAVDQGLLEEDSIFASAEQKRTKLEQQFNFFASAIDDYGALSGTGHKRVLIPKTIIDEEELQSLGFLATNVAIPEAGQTALRSYRHLDEKYHLHEFEKNWSVHEDTHHSSTMLIEKAKRAGEDSLWGNMNKVIEGLPHVLTEGVPGAVYYGMGKFTGAESMEHRLKEELPLEYLDFIDEYDQDIADMRTRRQSADYNNIKDLSLNYISGKDDAYNTIEGLRHGGLSENIRKDLTDFGSGFTRAVRNVFGIFKRNKQPLLTKAGMFSNKEVGALAKFSSKATPQEFADLLGVKYGRLPIKEQYYELATRKFTGAVNVTPSTITQKAIGRSPLIEMGLESNKAYVDPNALISSLYGKAGKKFTKEQQSVLKTAIFHEAAELRNVTGLTKGVEDTSRLKSILSTGQAHKTTLPQEELFLRSLGKKQSKIYEQFKKIRQMSDPEYGGYINTTASQKTKTTKQLALASKKASNTSMYANQSVIPIKSHKTIDGMHPGTKDSFGARLIKKLTDFGSKYDSLKAFAKTLGMNTDDLLKSTRFQKALQSGTQISELGQGGYGIAHKMRLEIEGQSLEYVKKTISPDAVQAFSKMPKELQSIKATFPIEAKAMQAAGREGISPSLYGHGKDTVFMELLSGKDAYELSRQGSFLSDATIEEVRKEAHALVQKGVLHKDIAHRNIMIDKVGKKVGLIDFGVTETVNNPSKEWLIASSKNVNKQFDELYEAQSNLKGYHSLEHGKTGMQQSKTGIGKIKPKIDPLAVTGMQEQLKDPRRTTRMKNFRAVSTNAVGIGFRSAHKAGRRHSRFASTGR